MKICLLAGKSDIRGGSTRHINDIVEGLRARGHTVEILTYTGNPLRYFKVVRQHARMVDIVHAIDLNPRGFIGYLATRFTKARFVISVIGTYAVSPLYSRKTAWLARIIYSKSDAILSISSFTKKEIEKLVPGVRIQVITPGIDLSNFRDVNKVHSNKGPYLLSVGSIKKRKGYDIALQAFIRIKREFPDLRYVIVGAHIDEPKFVEKLQQMTRESGVEGSVDFVKDISDAELCEYYQNAELFMLTSVNEGTHFEGFGIVFLEAAAYGLPSIGTSGNGIEDAVDDGKTAILVPQRDVEKTADAIRSILTNRSMRETMSENARKFAIAHDRLALAARYEDVYLSILNKEN
jgi:phosphatidylinositol alpha-1,6-mannosyltransferase